MLAGLEDLAHVGNGEYREAELRFDGLHRGRVGILGLFHTIHGKHQADDLHIRFGLELGNDLAYCGACGHHIVDEQYLHAVGQLGADHHAAVAMILLLLAVEGVADFHTVAGSQSDRGGDAQRNALVGRTENGVDVVRQIACFDFRRDLLRIECAERGDLTSVVECARIDEIRRLTTGLQRELAEFQRLRFQQELGKTVVEGFSHVMLL